MTVESDGEWCTRLDRIRESEALEPEVPSTLQAELRPYQYEGYRWLARLAHWGGGACLADDMGLGKTVQALACLLKRAPDGAPSYAPRANAARSCRRRSRATVIRAMDPLL